MSELEKKFYSKSWHEGLFGSKQETKKYAHDLTEIAEKKMISKDDYIKLAERGNKQLKRQEELYRDLRDLDNKNLQAIEELKKQIEDTKYLSYGEVEKLLYNCVLKNQEEYPVKEILEEYATAICNLAIKPLKNKIIKVLKKYIIYAIVSSNVGANIGTFASTVVINPEQIANEILQDKQNNIINKGDEDEK